MDEFSNSPPELPSHRAAPPSDDRPAARPRPPLTAARIGADRIYKALADPTRRQILWILAETDSLPVATIADRLDHISQPNLSHHLRILREAGLVHSDRDGQYVRYDLNDAAMRQFLVHFYGIYVKPRRAEASSIADLLR